MTTFVSVGTANQPFQRLLNAVAAVAPTLPQPVIVQCGHTPFAEASCVIIPFMSIDDYEATVARAALLIMQAGGGGVIHSIRAGKVPIIMPRRAAEGEHVDDHQFAWACELASMDKVVMINEPCQLPGAVAKVLSRPSRLHTAGEPRMVEMVGKALARIAQRVHSNTCEL